MGTGNCANVAPWGEPCNVAPPSGARKSNWLADIAAHRTRRKPGAPVAAPTDAPRDARSYRLCRYIMSTSSSYIASRSAPPAAIALAAQCLRWFRISSRPTDRSASCTEAIWVMTSAQ